ncbi:MAG: hypothetical protein MAG431_01019 [Chloroflexi bacterium]|nr:hypothetical protein [Chloroflexota bacterium]
MTLSGKFSEGALHSCFLECTAPRNHQGARRGDLRSLQVRGRETCAHRKLGRPAHIVQRPTSIIQFPPSDTQNLISNFLTRGAMHPTAGATHLALTPNLPNRGAMHPTAGAAHLAPTSNIQYLISTPQPIKPIPPNDGIHRRGKEVPVRAAFFSAVTNVCGGDLQEGGVDEVELFTQARQVTF